MDDPIGSKPVGLSRENIVSVLMYGHKGRTLVGQALRLNNNQARDEQHKERNDSLRYAVV
jgi:hypothetical protein